MDLGDGRHCDALEPLDDLLHAPLVCDPVIAGGERRELADVGARHEGVAGAAQHERADPRVAIDFVDLESGGSSEYFGRADRAALDALVAGRLEGYLRLDEVFWMFEDGEVERLDADIAYGASAYFRAEAIRRVTPVKDGFPEAARGLPPGDRIVPGPGRDA